ncbi:nicotinate-nucleotide--dimethylbenzimidazole phosphoribosyltransferase [Mycobacterium sp.]|uniref:nicotinate-nucleotide--dimethylbenzimidazole phosphoribosyltransferase n=1 Tax=Mycobacterium sp. TaxID=1785 RepID=UPI003A86E829
MIGFPAVGSPDVQGTPAGPAQASGTLGRLGNLAVWVAACQGQHPPHQFERARVVLFGEGHDTTLIDALAHLGGATVRVAGLGADLPSEPRSEESREETIRAIGAGRRIADEEVDAGADLLIAGAPGTGTTVAAATLVAALTNTEPVAVIGFGAGHRVDDAGWSRRTAAVRDALFQATPVLDDPVGLLDACAGAHVAAMAGFCAQAAIRRTPLLLDDMAVTAAALVAEKLAPGARQWWQAGHRAGGPGHSLALDALALEPVLDLSVMRGHGVGAAVALPILRAAVAAASSTAASWGQY